MKASVAHRPLEIEQIGSVTLLKFMVREILDVAILRLVKRQFADLVESGGCRHLLLSFRNVDRLTTPLIAEVLELNRKLKAIGGELALCAISPELYPIFDLLHLPKILRIHADEAEGLEHLRAV